MNFLPPFKGGWMNHVVLGGFQKNPISASHAEWSISLCPSSYRRPLLVLIFLCLLRLTYINGWKSESIYEKGSQVHVNLPPSHRSSSPWYDSLRRSMSPARVLAPPTLLNDFFFVADLKQMRLSVFSALCVFWRMCRVAYLDRNSPNRKKKHFSGT